MSSVHLGTGPGAATTGHTTPAAGQPGDQLPVAASSRTTAAMDTSYSTASSVSFSSSSTSSCVSSCSCHKPTKEFWQQYHRGRRLHSLWKLVKLYFKRRDSSSKPSSSPYSNQDNLDRSQSIQRFYEDLYFRQNKNRTSSPLEDTFHSYHSSQQSYYYHIEEEDPYYLPYQ